MKHLIACFVILTALFVAAPATQAAEWLSVVSQSGETYSINTDITASDDSTAYMVWVKNTFDTPEARSNYTTSRAYSSTVYYKETLYIFTADWNKFNIMRVVCYDATGNIIDQYDNTEASEMYYVGDGTITEYLCNAAQVVTQLRAGTAEYEQYIRNGGGQ